MAEPRNLFEHDLPMGLHYREDFVAYAEEHALLQVIAKVAFTNFEMRGVVARRRVAFFGASYDGTAAGLAQWSEVDPDAFAMAPLPEFLLPVRASIDRHTG